MLIVLTIATLLIVIASALPLSRHQHWVVRVMDFPRVQIAFMAAVLLVINCLCLDLTRAFSWCLVAAAGVCLLWQLKWVLPYTRVWSKEVNASKGSDPARELSIITANVLKTNRNSDALVELVSQYQPDILVTLESDKWWESRLEAIEVDLPYSVKCPLDNLYGMHVYSRLPFSDEVLSFLVEDDVPSVHLSLQLRSGDKVCMHFVHPAPPSPTENSESTERDAELICIAKKVAQTQGPIIVTGDLNDVAWSFTTRLFRKISGLLDPRIGRGMFNTFHADYPFLRWPLDHLFHSAHFKLKDIKRLPSIGSDHFPLFTVLVCEPERGASQNGIAADSEDHAVAQEIVDEKDVTTDDVPKPN